MSRLADMQLDPNVPVGLRKQFVADVKNRLSAHLHAPEDLHRELGVVASAQPQMYLRRGPIDLLDEQRIENLRCMIGSDL
jgi:hypothetical protein